MTLHAPLWKTAARTILTIALTSLPSHGARGEGFDIAARVEIRRAHPGRHTVAQEVGPGSVVWLSPQQKMPYLPAPVPQTQTLAQKNRQFSPHLLVVPVGSSVDFPNLDPFFHNVFSLFNGKRFDLGLYEAHTHRTVHFDREGVSYIFCNIHPQMGAVIVALSTPFHAMAAADGSVLMRGVPPGYYRLHVWAENVSVAQLANLEGDVTVDSTHTQLGTIRLEVGGDLMAQHENKFGKDYTDDPKPIY